VYAEGGNELGSIAFDGTVAGASSDAFRGDASRGNLTRSVAPPVLPDVDFARPG
jgi:hypothetical protein